MQPRTHGLTTLMRRAAHRPLVPGSHDATLPVFKRATPFFYQRLTDTRPVVCHCYPIVALQFPGPRKAGKGLGLSARRSISKYNKVPVSCPVSVSSPTTHVRLLLNTVHRQARRAQQIMLELEEMNELP
ncbi:hypothetical protein J6590_025176 [Homalodisca vitripennis]|nr:hypothetical protein J6590_025176 [Homalodisca vitripennis]